MSNVEQYIDAVRQCAQQCRQMLALEHDKRLALVNNEGSKIQHVISQQQAALMQLETLEKRRIEIQECMGVDRSATAQKVLERLPQGKGKEELSKAIAELTANATELRRQNKDNLELARLDLQIIESLQNRNNAYPTDAGVYRPGKSAPTALKKKFDGSF